MIEREYSNIYVLITGGEEVWGATGRRFCNWIQIHCFARGLFQLKWWSVAWFDHSWEKAIILLRDLFRHWKILIHGVHSYSRLIKCNISLQLHRKAYIWTLARNWKLKLSSRLSPAEPSSSPWLEWWSICWSLSLTIVAVRPKYNQSEIWNWIWQEGVELHTEWGWGWRFRRRRRGHFCLCVHL